MKKKVVHYLIQNLDNEGPESPKLPFTLSMEHEFQKQKVNVKISETTFQFGVDQVEPFLRKHGIEKDHFVCFDEIVCQRYSNAFVDGLLELKCNVAALWLAIGGKSVKGRFAKKAIENAGFWCPEMSYPLRNPLHIARYSHSISQDAPKNMLDICLQNDIKSSPETTIIEGRLIKIDKTDSFYCDAIVGALEQVPSQKYAMIFIDADQLNDQSLLAIYDQIERPKPDMITKSQEFVKYQKWLCSPEKRKNDLCIFGVNHKSNGIQTDIVIHVLPQNCPMCGFSSEDPVIASRAMAILIVATYQRSSCPNCR